MEAGGARDERNRMGKMPVDETSNKQRKTPEKTPVLRGKSVHCSEKF
jgi:hypothetical protein